MALKVKAGGVRRDITAIKVKQGTNRRDIVAVFERQGHTRRKLWTHPTAPQITSFSINPTFANDDTYTAASPNQNVAISWAITSTPALTALTLEYTRRDGINGAVAITTTSRSASVVMERQDATYTLTATNANGSTHAVAKFTYRHYPTISRFTRTGFSQSPGIAPSGTLQLGYTFAGNPAITSAVITGNDGTTYTAHFSRTTGNTFTGSVRIVQPLTSTTRAVIYTLTIRDGLPGRLATATYNFTWPQG